MRENFYAGILGQNTNLPQDLCSISDDELIQTVEHMLSELGVNSNKTKAKDERIQQIIANIVLGKWLNYSVKEIAEAVFLSESRLTHLFKEEAGVSLKSYILIRKMERAYKYVSSGGKITQAAQEAGFSSSAHLAYTCKTLTGISITDVLKHH